VVRMPVRRLILWVVLACAVTYLVEFYSFALAHSPAGLLAVLVCPGILVSVLNVFGENSLRWIVAVAIDVLFYEVIWRTFAAWRLRKAKT
jgi:hypothetical protein